MQRGFGGLVLLAALASGAAGLIYEIAWIRLASGLLGANTYAVSSVLAVFFGGLACGSAAFGRLGWGAARPVRAFAWVELLVALLASATPALFGWADEAFGRLYRALGGDGALLFGGRIALVSLILLPPTFLMGATLPLVSRALARHDARIASSVGLVYAANTLGAVAGCLACGVFLLPRLGVAGSIGTGVGLGVLAAGLAGVASAGWGAVPAATRRGERLAEEPARSSAHAWLRGLVFAAGFVAVGAQVLWVRFLALLVPNGVHTYTFTLASVLLGIVAGSVLAAWIGDRVGRPVLVFAVLQIAQAWLVLLEVHLPAVWLRAAAGLGGVGGEASPAGAAFLPCLLVLLPAALSGASLPIAIRAVTRGAASVGRQVGVLTALNTLGGIGGSLAVGFALLPGLGLERSFLGVSGLSVAIGVAALWLATPPSHAVPRRTRWLGALTAVAVWVSIPVLRDSRIPHDHLVDPGDRLVAVFEGLSANVAVVEREGSPSLEIDRWWQGQASASQQRLAAHLPMLLHPDPRRVLVVGLGAGLTPSRFLLHAAGRVDVVEIEPAVVSAVRTFFRGPEGAASWLDDPRLHLLEEDGRTVLRHAAERWDVISLELGQVFRPGVASFYDVELYVRARARLEPGGLLTQFLPISFFEPEELRRAVASFLAVFPESALWYNTSELLLVGFRDGPAPDIGERILARLEARRIREDLAFSHWGGAERLLSRAEVLAGGLLLGPRELRRLAADAAPFRDERPELEYRSSGRRPSPERELANAELLGAHPASAGSLPPAFRSLVGIAPAPAVDEVRRLNAAALAIDARVRLVAESADRQTREDAFAALARSRSLHPEHGALHRALADRALREGRWRAAAELFEVAMRAVPQDPLAWKGRAFALHRGGSLDRARSAYRSALALRPADAELLNGLGSLEAERGRYPVARALFERAVAADADYLPARRNLDQLERISGR